MQFLYIGYSIFKMWGAGTIVLFIVILCLIVWFYIEVLHGIYTNVGWKVMELNEGDELSIPIPDDNLIGDLRFSDAKYTVVAAGETYEHDVTENLRRMVEGMNNEFTGGPDYREGGMRRKFTLDAPLNGGSFPIPGLSDKATLQAAVDRLGVTTAAAQYRDSISSVHLTLRYKFGKNSNAV